MTPDEMKRVGYLKIFISYYKPHKALFFLDMICALCIAVIDLAFPYVSRLSMTTLLPQGIFSTFFAIMGIFFLAYVVKAGLYFIVGYWGHTMGVRIETDMRDALFAHMQRLSFGFYDKNRTGNLMSHLTGDLFEITELAHHGPEDVFISVVTLIGSFVVLMTIRWELALMVFAVVPLFLIFTVIQRKNMRIASDKVKTKLAGVNEEIQSSISGMRTAKTFANEETEAQKFITSNVWYRTAKQEYYKSMSYYLAGLEFSMSILSVLVIAMGGYMIMQGQMDYVDLITFSLYVTTFITPIRKLSNFIELFAQGMAGFKRFVGIMRVEPDIVDSDDAVDLKDVQGDIQVNGVSFRYEGQSDKVLDNVSLHIQAGETVAVVGPSGGGKSTLCQLLPRFYDVTEGEILVDGTDIRQVTQHTLRKNIGLVQQDVFLFAGTIYDNIQYGRPGATEEEIHQAARKAEIYADIMEMPDGFQSQVGERGVLLSGGQKQRISIARIFLKNPPILILDEATSALDSVTEVRIQSAFDELARGRTTLIIAHRLSTIRGANRIFVVDGAGIAEEGTHQALMEKDGEYAQLYKAQTLVADDGR